MPIETGPWRIQDHIATAERQLGYLEAAFEDGDPALIAAAIGDIARARGMSRVARQAGVTREAIYKALSHRGDPRLSTLVGVLKALGIAVVPKRVEASPRGESPRPHLPGLSPATNPRRASFATVPPGRGARWRVPMASKEKTLSDAFYETLKDVYYAEKQSVRALTKSAKAARAAELKSAFEAHRDESAGQVERLEQVFEILGKPARAKTCEAMQGIVHEMQEDLEDFGGTDAGDAVLIGCAQAVEHYEIARYGMLKTWARQLGLDDAAKLLDETLGEEKAADEKLTAIAESMINAQGGEGEIEEEEDEADEDKEANAKLAKSDDAGKAPAKSPAKPRQPAAAR